MESFKKAILLASTIIAVLAAEDGLEEKFELMISQISQLKTDVLTRELESLSTLTAFDCYITESWTTQGIIQFNGCSGTISDLIHSLADF